MKRSSLYAFDYNLGTKERLVLAVLNRLCTGSYLSETSLQDLKEQAIFEGGVEQWFNKLKPIYSEEYPCHYATYYK